MFSVVVALVIGFYYIFVNQRLQRIDNQKIPKMKIVDVNELAPEKFVVMFGNIVELWPQAAKAVVTQRPFDSRHSLHLAFATYLENLSIQEKVAVLQSHPDLAGKLINENEISIDSTNEQNAAGLNQLTEQQKKELIKLSAEYTAKFGFPFVICVRQSNKIERILDGFRERLPNSREIEIENGINQVEHISMLRIDNIVEN